MRRIVKVAVGVVGVVVLGAVVERMVIAAPHYRGPASDHFDGRRFHNQDLEWRSKGLMKWQMNRKPGVWRDWVESPPGPKPPERVGRGHLRVTFVGHATLLIQIDGVNILTDPIWSERCSPVSFAGPKRHRPPGIRFEDLPPIDAVLISHNHYDHLDLPTLRMLGTRNGPAIVTLLGNGALMKEHDVKGKILDLDWWQSARVSDRVEITVVPAEHFCSRGMSDQNATLWGGFVIRGASGSVYFAGDTGSGRHFGQIAQRFGPMRAALLPIGAYLPRWFMKPIHTSPADVVAAHKLLGARTTIPMHYGTFDLGDDGELQALNELRAVLAANGNPAFRLLDFGEGADLP